MSIVALGLVALSLAGVGCSALVASDPGSRPGEDGGRADAGERPDAGMPIDGDIPCPDCDDSIACTIERCVDGTCESTPDDAMCGVGERCQAGVGCVPIRCRDNGDCRDDRFCNGEERCAPDADGADPATGCVAGVAVDCDDGATCSADVCDEDADRCVSTPGDAACDDGIECTVDACSPGDAADPSGCVSAPTDHLCNGFCTMGGRCSIEAGGCVGATERECTDGDACTIDSCSEARRMCLFQPRDDDGDGAPAMSVGPRRCLGGTDCDDTNPAVGPTAVEGCNGRDDDCDGAVDEACTVIPDTCADAEAIVVAPGGTASVSGVLGAFTSDYNTVCGRTGGADAVFYVDVAEVSDLVIDTVGSTADTVLAVGTTCSNTGFRLGCDDDVVAGVEYQSRVFVHRFGPAPTERTRRLYILVDGFDSSAVGAFTLNVSLTRPAATDACRAPIDISDGGSLVGFIGPAVSVITMTGSCQTLAEGGLNEAVAAFTGPADGDVTIATYSDSFDPDLYVRAAPCATGSEVACIRGNNTGAAGYRYASGLAVDVTAGSSYFLFVDGASAAGSYFVSYEP
jgi:hypothetical protein